MSVERSESRESDFEERQAKLDKKIDEFKVKFELKKRFEDYIEELVAAGIGENVRAIPQEQLALALHEKSKAIKKEHTIAMMNPEEQQMMAEIEEI